MPRILGYVFADIEGAIRRRDETEETSQGSGPLPTHQIGDRFWLKGHLRSRLVR